MYQAPRGTGDILPELEPYWQFVSEKAAETARGYGYGRLETPVFENADLFRRSVGAGTDIVEKEMYVFEDLGGSKLALKPEGTAPVCRAYLEHGMMNLPQPVKLYYITPVFRYERPQAGRLREHHQFGYEAIGDADPSLDAEVIDMAWQFFNSLGISSLKLQLNSIGCEKCRPGYLRALKDYYEKYTTAICRDCLVRYEKNPLRLLDCKQASCQQIADSAPRSVDHLCPECREHFEKLKTYLGILGIPFVLNHRLVRGLDYYTRTVFEIQPEIEGGQSTIGGGGRYDNLISELGGKPTPAVGFATGIERIILNLKRQNSAIPVLPQPQVFIADTGGAARNEAVRLAQSLRRVGIGVIQAPGAKSLRAQMRQANSLGMRLSIIIGEEELKTGTVQLRDMATASQEKVTTDKLISTLKDKIIIRKL
ncbi:MAG: histidine--tRNA ligase [Chloroflexota bacterium]